MISTSNKFLLKTCKELKSKMTKMLPSKRRKPKIKNLLMPVFKVKNLREKLRKLRIKLMLKRQKIKSSKKEIDLMVLFIDQMVLEDSGKADKKLEVLTIG